MRTIVPALTMAAERMVDVPGAADERGGGTLTRARWPYLGPPQLRLLLASFAILIGSFLPWVDTAFGTFTGMAGPGVWTFYAGIVGLAGALLRRRRLALTHAWVAGVACVALPVWQGARLLRLCEGGACVPATGLVLVLGAGVYACLQAHRMTQLASTTP